MNSLYFSKNIVYEEESAKCEFFLNIYNFKNIACSSIISCVCVAPVQMHSQPNMKDLSLTMLSGEPHKEIT